MTDNSSKLTTDEIEVVNRELNRIIQSYAVPGVKSDTHKYDFIEMLKKWENDLLRDLDDAYLVDSEYIMTLTTRDTIEKLLSSLSDNLRQKVVAKVSRIDDVLKSMTVTTDKPLSPKIEFKNDELQAEAVRLMMSNSAEYKNALQQAKQDFERQFTLNRNAVIDTPWATLSSPDWWWFQLPKKGFT